MHDIALKQPKNCSALSSADLYHPPDVEDAYATYGASCGPAALAAILKRSVMSLRPYLGDFEQRGYMNPTHMRGALSQLGIVRVRSISPEALPSYGLLFLQWTGPWLQPGVPVAAAYRYTHWVGTAMTEDHGQMLYEINIWNREHRLGDWVSFALWAQAIPPAITSTIKRADGGYYVRTALEVTHG